MLRDELKEWANNNKEYFETHRKEGEYDKEDLEGKDGDKEKYGYKGDIDWNLLPTLVFPIELVTEDGIVSSISDKRELFQLKHSCQKDFYGSKGRHGHIKGDNCFKLVFPISLELPNGGLITGTDRMDLKRQLREWKKDQTGEKEKPMLHYPVTVELEDGTTIELASIDDLKALKESCSND